MEDIDEVTLALECAKLIEFADSNIKQINGEREENNDVQDYYLVF